MEILALCIALVISVIFEASKASFFLLLIFAMDDRHEPTDASLLHPHLIPSCIMLAPVLG